MHNSVLEMSLSRCHDFNWLNKSDMFVGAGLFYNDLDLWVAPDWHFNYYCFSRQSGPALLLLSDRFSMMGFKLRSTKRG